VPHLKEHTRRRRWKDAAEDLQKARELEEVAYGYSSGFVLVALGNAKGAVGEWQASHLLTLVPRCERCLHGRWFPLLTNDSPRFP
jgi:hypothetical protein